jgi:spore germination protein GerM
MRQSWLSLSRYPCSVPKPYSVSDSTDAPTSSPVVNRGIAPADPATVLALLANGPSQAETDAGLRTALVPDLAQIIEIDGELITIDLDGEFNALAPTEQRLALAQITYAMTQLAAISKVKFLVAGQPASVPRGDGSSTDGPVSPDDYTDFAPL